MDDADDDLDATDEPLLDLDLDLSAPDLGLPPSLTPSSLT